jgi:hypothetical protein
MNEVCKTHISDHTSCPVDLKRLQMPGGSIDVERPTMFGFSGHRSSKPFLGEVGGKTFAYCSASMEAVTPCQLFLRESSNSARKLAGQMDGFATIRPLRCARGLFCFRLQCLSRSVGIQREL